MTRPDVSIYSDNTHSQVFEVRKEVNFWLKAWKFYLFYVLYGLRNLNMISVSAWNNRVTDL